MAIPFKSPKPPQKVVFASEKTTLKAHFEHRKVPRTTSNRLLLASWNVANLGAQGRAKPALQVIAYILSHFDLVALQELNDNFSNFKQIMGFLGNQFKYVMSDTAGNEERLAFIYRKSRVSPMNLFGELSLRPLTYPKQTVKVKWNDKGTLRVDTFKDHRFVPFDRNPYIGSFKSQEVEIVLANVHLYFGKFQDSKTRSEREKYARRVLEIYTLSRWANQRFKKHTTYRKNIILLGDMNVPAMDPKESTFKALVRFGWESVNYTTKTGGSNLGNDKTYDQMTIAPGTIGNRIVDSGVFDFDKVVFRTLWNKLTQNGTKATQKAIGKFNAYVKHHFSDHRPLWVQLRTN